MGRGDLSMQTHSLLRIDSADAVHGASGPAPPWVRERLAQAPWVVVRRARCHDGLVPVGVRGGTRAERFAGWLRPESVRACVSPLQLAARRDWCRNARRAEIAALAALDDAQTIMARADLAARWGITGSVAFELVSGCATTSGASDLDLVVRLDGPLSAAAALALDAALTRLAARADVLLETPAGAVALAEYARARAPYLLRTADGPRLLADPWAPASASA
jgi:phosphoribosyl-dephospho-CoA transferase